MSVCRWRLILHWIDKDTYCIKNTFQSIFQKVHTNYPSIGWSHVLLVPFAMADHRLARQMPRRCLWYVFLLLRDNHDLKTLCLLSVHHLLRRWYTVFARAILNFGILYLWLLCRLVDRELARNFLVDPSRRQVGHPCCMPPLLYAIQWESCRWTQVNVFPRCSDQMSS